MQISPVLATVSARTVERINNTPTVKVEDAPRPEFNNTSPNISKSVEISKDPPGTITRFTNSDTDQVVLQIPSEVQLRIYKDTARFLEQRGQNRVNETA